MPNTPTSPAGNSTQTPFVVRRRQVELSNDEHYNPLTKGTQNSYIAVTQGNKVVIYETFRKAKPIRRATYTNTTSKQAISKFKEKPYIYHRISLRGLTPYFRTEYDYTNRVPTAKDKKNKALDWLQLQALVEVTREKGNLSERYVGYSGIINIHHHTPTPEELAMLDEEAMRHATINFINNHRKTILSDEQYDEFLKGKKELKGYTADILDRRYIITKEYVRRTKAAIRDGVTRS